MQEAASINFNIHAYWLNRQFAPSVADFMSSGDEIISVDLTGNAHNVLLTRERLHQLKDVLVAACERYPVAVADEKAATWADKYRPVLAEGR